MEAMKSWSRFLVKIFESFVDPGGQMRIAAAFVSMRIAAAFVLIAPALATVEVRDAGEMGLGVFATSAIAADTVLGFYEGEIIEGERLAECTEPEGAPDPCCFYRVQLDATRVIDGAHAARREDGGCADLRRARLHWSARVNHAHGAPAENVRLRALAGARLALVAARDIDAGEPLAFDYGYAYWMNAARILGRDVDVLDDDRPYYRAGDAAGAARVAVRAVTADVFAGWLGADAPTPSRATDGYGAEADGDLRAAWALFEADAAPASSCAMVRLLLPLLPAAQRERAEEGLASSDLYTRCAEISGDARRDDACAAALSDCETALRLTEALAAVTIGDGLVRGSAADDL